MFFLFYRFILFVEILTFAKKKTLFYFALSFLSRFFGWFVCLKCRSDRRIHHLLAISCLSFNDFLMVKFLPFCLTFATVRCKCCPLEISHVFLIGMSKFCFFYFLLVRFVQICIQVPQEIKSWKRHCLPCMPLPFTLCKFFLFLSLICNLYHTYIFLQTP